MMKKRKSSLPHQITLPVFSFSLFTSAALMFSVQPLAGKMLLPLVGGSPSGWVVAMAFFQIALLAGYALAHLLSKLQVRLHGVALTLLLLCGLSVLPVSIAEKWQMIGTVDQPSLKVLTVLALATGLPFIALSVTSPTLQRLFSATGHTESHDPYFLYAASNIGSFIGLFAYPLVLEPLLGLKNQSQSWLLGYALLILLSLFCLLLATNPAQQKAAAKTQDKTKPEERRRQRLMWLALSFVPSSLMLGVTAHITTDVASAPLIWVIPLALYLLTHIIAFSRKRIVSPAFVNFAQPIATALIILWSLSGLEEKSWVLMLMHLAAFWFCAQMCHMRLADSRPPVSRLTEFYLFIALGGALGGSFNAFVAPFVFSLPIEYPIMLVLCCALHPRFSQSIPKKFRDLCTPLAVSAAVALALSRVLEITQTTGTLVLLMTICVLVTTRHPRTLFYTIALLLVVGQVSPARTNMLHKERNFFGVIKVTEDKLNGERIRILRHGTTLHGFQVMTPEPQTKPVSYYTVDGPADDLFNVVNPRRAGVIGLGTGILTCYAAKGRSFDYYEIDPAVVDTAQKWFTFLKDCEVETKFHVGDGRLELEKNASAKYDLLILDAFSSDAIPLHLLTVEAFALYRDRMAPNGIIGVHISNRFLDLKQPIAATAEHLGFQVLQRLYIAPRDSFGQTTEWLALAPQGADTAALEKRGWKKISAKPDYRLWTDDFSNMLSALRL